MRGDVGAKHIIGDYEEFVTEVELNDASVITDLDTPEVYAELVNKGELGTEPAVDSTTKL